MCGITGIFSTIDTDLNKVITSMTKVLNHRGPDNIDFYLGQNIAFGHTRLSIIDLSESSNQPMSNAGGRYTIVFNGEIYNFLEVKSKLHDYPFRTDGDTEVVLAAYIKWGEKCLNEFNGMFAFAIWDTLKEELFLARDRLGVKPLYYYKNDNLFLFSSEIRSILKSNLVERKLNINVVSDFLRYQSVKEPNTLVSGISQIQAGEYAIVSQNDFILKKYWDILRNKRKPFINDYEEVKSGVYNCLKKSICLRMVSDVPMGVFLSGGIDSCVITGLMAEQSEKPLNTLTIGFNEKEFDESKIAKIVAEKYSTNHQNIILNSSDLLSELPQFLSSMDNPSCDGLNTYVVSKIAKDAGLKVVHSGLGGDELFGGYGLYKKLVFFSKNRWIWDLPEFIKSFSSFFIKTNRLNEKYKSFFSDEYSFISNYSTIRKVYLDEPLFKILKLNKSLINANSIVEGLEKVRQDLESLPLVSQITYSDLYTYTKPVLLKDSDQMSMAHSVELREPFFDFELIEYVIGIPDKFKPIKNQKQLLVDSMRAYIPKEVLNKKKQGFNIPFELWLKNELRGFCLENLECLPPEIFNIKEILKMWDGFLSNKGNVFWAEIWSLVVLSFWIKENKITC